MALQESYPFLKPLKMERAPQPKEIRPRGLVRKILYEGKQMQQLFKKGAK